MARPSDSVPGRGLPFSKDVSPKTPSAAESVQDMNGAPTLTGTDFGSVVLMLIKTSPAGVFVPDNLGACGDGGVPQCANALRDGSRGPSVAVTLKTVVPIMRFHIKFTQKSALMRTGSKVPSISLQEEGAMLARARTTRTST